MSGVYGVNIDLDDWEKVLRVECHPELQSGLIEEQIANIGMESYLMDFINKQHVPNVY